MAVVGPSGSGKSTALRVIAGLERPDGGRVLLGGRDVSEVRASEREVSMVFQSFALFPHLSVERNIGFGLSARGTEPVETRRRVAETAEWLGLSGLLARRPADLSGGERQRVALARALMSAPDLLLLDEPLAAVDVERRRRILPYLLRVRDDLGVPVIYVSHDRAEVDQLADRVIVLDSGRVLRT